MKPLIPQVRLFLLVAVSLTANACTETIYRSMNDPARDEWQQPTAVIKSLKIDSGARIADFGAGGGEGAKRGGLPSNIQFVLADSDATALAENSVDLLDEFEYLPKQCLQVFVIAAP